MEQYLPLIIQLVTGVIGGNIAGRLLRSRSLGFIGNSVAGILGGGIGGMVLGFLGLGDDVGGLPAVLLSIVGGGVGGALVMAFIGALRTAFVK